MSWEEKEHNLRLEKEKRERKIPKAGHSMREIPRVRPRWKLRRNNRAQRNTHGRSKHWVSERYPFTNRLTYTLFSLKSKVFGVTNGLLESKLFSRVVKRHGSADGRASFSTARISAIQYDANALMHLKRDAIQEDRSGTSPYFLQQHRALLFSPTIK